MLEFHYDRPHQIAKFTPHFRNFFLGELFSRKIPPWHYGWSNFQKEKQLQSWRNWKAIHVLSMTSCPGFCWLKVSSPSRKVNAINQRKVLMWNFRFLADRQKWFEKTKTAFPKQMYFIFALVPSTFCKFMDWFIQITWMW